MVLPFQVALFSGVSVAALMASGAVDAYAVGGNAPEFVADFAGTLNSGTEYYRSGGADTTFSSVFTHSGLVAPATMTDSDGDLKWAPHNFIPDSENLSAWTASGSPTITSGQSDLNGGTDATSVTATSNVDTKIQKNSGVTHSIGTKLRIEVSAKYNSGNGWLLVFPVNTAASAAAWFDIQNGTTGTVQANATASIVSLGSGWYRCRVDFTVSTAASTQVALEIASANNSSVAATGDSIIIYRSRLHRYDLGGMVNNPDTGDSYVPTTTAAKFLPRRNHYLFNGSTYDKAGILIESSAATNLATYSNDFTNAAWSTNAANETLTASASTGPDGATSMTRLNDDSGTGTGEVYVDQAVTVATSTAYTFSVYAKSDQLSWIALGAENFTTPANGESFFNLGAGTVGTAATGHTARIENVASGIYRCSITFTTDSSDTSGNIRIYVADADTDITVDRDGTSSVYIYGAQFEAGSVPTSYIPVVAGSTVTRAAETLTVAGANLPANTTAMSFNISGKVTYADQGAVRQVVFWSLYKGSVDYIIADIETTASLTGQAQVDQRDAVAGLDSALVATPQLSPGINVNYSHAIRSTSGAVNVALNGTSGTANTTVTALSDFSSTDLSFGRFSSTTGTGGHFTISLYRMWGTDIGDAGIEEAST